MNYATIADFFLRLGMYFDARSGRSPLYLHHQRRCIKCKKPISRYHKFTTNPYRHIDCAYPDGRYPLPEPLGSFTDDAA